ncbi:unnamed protein product [Meloidogyne enterolobii]|uniref:Uncharacterized protein n=1 Tax=Meloidogyne enterolobii TaxID=390850 RepID=A0ACB1B4D2_MELEN
MKKRLPSFVILTTILVQLLDKTILRSMIYVNRIIEQALDTYKKKRNQKMEVEPKLAAIIDRIFQQNLERRDFNSVICLAFDTRRIDMVEAAIKSNEAEKTPVMIETLNKVWESQLDIEFRTLVLDLIFHTLDADLQIEKKGSQNFALKVLSICQGHEREARKILDPYLPRGYVDPYGFKGGALCVYGLFLFLNPFVTVQAWHPTLLARRVHPLKKKSF